jgi:hypothetical protein
VDSDGDQVKEIIDRWRAKREEHLRSGSTPRRVGVDFEGHGVLLVAKDTIADDTPLCLGLGETGNNLKLVPCFEDWVPETLAPSWETGGVIVEETLPNNRWEIGPCTSDGALKRLYVLGIFAVSAALCAIL